MNKENNSSSQSGPRGPDTQASRFLFPILFCVIVVQSFKEYYGLRRATRYLAKQTSEEKMIWVEIYHLFETICSKMSVVWLYRPMHRPLIFTVEKINNINNKVCMKHCLRRVKIKRSQDKKLNSLPMTTYLYYYRSQ